jgi:hypothetical protein
LYKFVVAILCTPLLYLVHYVIELYLAKEGNAGAGDPVE